MSRVIKSSFISENLDTEKESGKYNNIDLEKQLSNLKKEIIKSTEIEKEKILDDAKIKSNNIVNEANKQAENLLAETYDKSTIIIEEYKEKGFKKGYDEGFKEAKEKSELLIEEAINIKNKNIKNKENMMINLEKDIIELVIDSCKEIMNRMYEDDREMILSIIQKGLDNLSNTKKIVIKTSKNDFDFLEMYKDKILSMANNIENIEIVTDKNLEKGGIILESLKGSVDVSIDTQLKELEIILKDLLDSE